MKNCQDNRNVGKGHETKRGENGGTQSSSTLQYRAAGRQSRQSNLTDTHPCPQLNVFGGRMTRGRTTNTTNCHEFGSLHWPQLSLVPSSRQNAAEKANISTRILKCSSWPILRNASGKRGISPTAGNGQGSVVSIKRAVQVSPETLCS